MQGMQHPLNSLFSMKRTHKSMPAGGKHVREQQVHPLLVVAIQMILESHRCSGRRSPMQGCTKPLGAQKRRGLDRQSFLGAAGDTRRVEGSRGWVFSPFVVL